MIMLALSFSLFPQVQNSHAAFWAIFEHLTLIVKGWSKHSIGASYGLNPPFTHLGSSLARYLTKVVDAKIA